MKNWRNTLIGPDDGIIRALQALDSSALQIILVVDGSGRLLGTVTDGDVRRGILKGIQLDAPVSAIMNRNFHTGLAGTERLVLLARMRRDNLHQLPILDGAGLVVGLETLEELLHIQDRDNWVVLMAGGEGRRLYPLTKDVPKPLLSVGSKPLLETILERFIEAGFRSFFISVNYLADQVERHFGDGSAWGVDIRYLREDRKLGTAGALALLPDHPTQPLMVMNGDILTNVDLKQVLAFHRDQGAAATMCVREHAVQIPYGVARMDGPRLLGLEEKPIIRNQVNAGIYVLDPEAVAMIPGGKPFNMTDVFEGLVHAGRPCAAYTIRDYWLDIGRHDDFDRANSEFGEIFG